MANNVIGLFENESVAESVVEELVASGFKESVIKRFRGNNNQLEDELRREGIPADEASYYVNGLNEGGALVSVRAEESETDSAVDIMNRYVNTGQSGSSLDDAGVTGLDSAAAGNASYQGSNAGWDESGDSGKGVDAAGVDYDGAGAAVGGSSTSSFPIGREAYASYTRRQPVAGASTSGSNSSMGFPIGREAYAAYTRPDRASASRGQAVENTDSWTETGSQSSGLSVGREAYEAYSREKASKWNK